MRFSFFWRSISVAFAIMLLPYRMAFAVPDLKIDDPVEQCAKGVQFFEDNQSQEALPLLEAGFAELQNNALQTDLELGKCALVLGLARNEVNNDLNGALEVYKIALNIFQNVHDQMYEGITLNNMGIATYGLGNSSEAISLLQRSLTIRQEIADRDGALVTLSNLGQVYRSVGNYGKALETYQDGLALAHYLGNLQSEAKFLYSVGTVYDVQGRPVDALQYYLDAIKLAYRVKDLQTASGASKGLTFILIALGRLPEGVEIQQNLVKLARDLGDKTSEYTALTELGYIYYQLGQFDNAREVLNQALSIEEELSFPAVQEDTWRGIGWTLEAQSDYEGALDAYQKALEISISLQDQRGQAINLKAIGYIYQLLSEPNTALNYYEQSMDIFEELRPLAGSEIAKIQFMDQYSDLYSNAIELYIGVGDYENAFKTSERGRARSFLDSMVEQRIYLSDQDMQEYLPSGLSSANKDNSVESKSLLGKLLDQWRSDLFGDAPTPTDSQTPSSGMEISANAYLHLADVQRLIDDQTTMLSFWVNNEETFAFVVTRTDLHVYSLDIGRLTLTEQIKAFRTFSNLDVAYPEPAIALYNLIIAPFKDKLTTPKIIVIPHGSLHYLPFAALTDGNRYLVDDYLITYLPSASSLEFISRSDSITQLPAPLIIGNPIVSNSDIKPLLFAEQEAKSISTNYGVNPYVTSMATETILMEKAPESGVIHLATHAYLTYQDPLQSSILLAADEKNDGRLTVREIYSLNLKNTQLVVLSACETQIGQLSTGDELIGFTRAFFFAGTLNVVASLWSVDDRPTTILMQQFHSNIAQGDSVVEALQKAQIATRAEYPNPYYWSGFVASGVGASLPKMENPAKSFSNFCWGLAIMVIVWSFLNSILNRESSKKG